MSSKVSFTHTVPSEDDLHQRALTDREEALYSLLTTCFNTLNPCKHQHSATTCISVVRVTFSTVQAEHDCWDHYCSVAMHTITAASYVQPLPLPLQLKGEQLSCGGKNSAQPCLFSVFPTKSVVEAKRVCN